MNEAIIVELRFFVTSVLSGVLLLVIYDFLRILRRLVKHGVFLVALEDIIYWITCGILIFLMMYEQNDGIIRGFSILAMLIGMIIYHGGISDFVVNFISGVLNKILTLIGKGIALIFKPFHFLVHKLRKIFRWLFLKIKLFVLYLLKALKKLKKSSKIAVSENEKGD